MCHQTRSAGTGCEAPGSAPNFCCGTVPHNHGAPSSTDTLFTECHPQQSALGPACSLSCFPHGGNKVPPGESLICARKKRPTAVWSWCFCRREWKGRGRWDRGRQETCGGSLGWEVFAPHPELWLGNLDTHFPKRAQQGGGDTYSAAVLGLETSAGWATVHTVPAQG